jgi:hypothetical protein
MQKTVAMLLVASALVSARIVRGTDDQADARAIVAKAIRAAGGEEKLSRYQGQTWKEQATYIGRGDPEHYEATYAAQWPDKLKVAIASQFTLVLNGEKGWMKTDGKKRDMSKQELEEHGEGTYAVWLMSLLPLRESAFELTALGQQQVGDRAAAGVRVRRHGHGDVSLYFDQETGLLLRCDTRYKDARTGSEIDQEMTFSAYRDQDGSGVKSPTKVSIRRNGKQVVEADMEFKHVERLDERLFSKP